MICLNQKGLAKRLNLLEQTMSERQSKAMKVTQTKSKTDVDGDISVKKSGRLANATQIRLG